jgi:Mn2+/Fe2+ NRAMP family transporter
MMTNVDAPSIITAAETGALYGYGLIWLILLLTIPLFFIQEASGRIGAVTHKGLGEIVRAIRLFGVCGSSGAGKQI